MNRRERVREATYSEIHGIARGLLVESGPGAVTISAIARAMGVSAPALYRYFPSHQDLLAGLATVLYQDFSRRMDQARRATESPVESARLLAMCRAMRAWSAAHPEEFRFLFASPSLPDAGGAAAAFGAMFLNELSTIWQHTRFPAAGAQPIPPKLAEQLQAYADKTGGALPAAAIGLFLTCWVRLCGMLTMEVLGQLDFALTDYEPFFEQTLREFCSALAVDYAEPSK